mgnify:CR=1 FL=1
MRLHGDVERRNGLVGHDDLRIERQRASDADGLSLAAGKLVRITLGGSGAEPTSDSSSPARACAFSGFSPWTIGPWAMMSMTRLRGASEAIRVLKNHLNVTAQHTQLAARGLQHVCVADHDGAVVRLEQPGNAARDRGLARAAFADNPERFAFAQLKRYIVDGDDRIAPAAEQGALA